MNDKLKIALEHPIWINHIRNVSLYTMDDKSERWRLVYYPIFSDGKTNEEYNEPRALMQNIEQKGFWSKEVPLRYIQLIK
jgi:hypothetical protein